MGDDALVGVTGGWLGVVDQGEKADQVWDLRERVSQHSWAHYRHYFHILLAVLHESTVFFTKARMDVETLHQSLWLPILLIILIFVRISGRRILI